MGRVRKDVQVIRGTVRCGSLFILLLPLLLHVLIHIIQVGDLPPVSLIHEFLLLFLVVGPEGGIEAGLAQFPGHFLQALLVDDGVGGHLGEGDVGAQDAQSGVAGRCAVALHVDDPGRGLIVRYSQGHSESFADQSWFELLGLALILLALVVGISEDRQFALGLVLEEGIMQDRVFDIDLAQFRIHAFLQFLPYHLGPIPFREGVSQFTYARGLDEFRQFEHGLEDAAFGLQEL